MKVPLAFSILCHSNLGILEVLLASIFRPQNYYCIYVDNKAPLEFLNNVKRIINAYKIKFSKTYIFLAKEPRKNIYWGSATLLEAQLSCLEQLLKRFEYGKYISMSLPMDRRKTKLLISLIIEGCPDTLIMRFTAKPYILWKI